MIKKAITITITALLVVLGLTKYIDWLCQKSEPIIIETHTPVITAPYTSIQPVEHNEPIEITIESVKPVYEGVALSDDLTDYLLLRCEVYAVDPSLAMALLKSESHGIWTYGSLDRKSVV